MSSYCEVVILTLVYNNNTVSNQQWHSVFCRVLDGVASTSCDCCSCTLHTSR